jgi:FtsP/CotA-like multicopper oxidase with cupredoxin domain
MPDHFLLKKTSLWNRRQLLKLGLAGIGVTGAAVAVQQFAQHGYSPKMVKIPPSPSDAPPAGNGISPMAALRDFDYGTVKRENGRTIREFRIIAGNSILQLNSAIAFNSWNFNNRVPGPTLRATEGDRVRVIFLNKGGHAHTMHFHGIHPTEVDGIRPVRNGTASIYEFDAEPYGVHLYHCHIAPITRHIGKGLYGCSSLTHPKSDRQRTRWCW